VLDVQIANDIGNVEGDEARLLQVVGNLLDNAIKFTPEHGRIGLSACRTNGEITVEVADNGRGIRPALLEHVFDVFSQIEDDSDHTAGLGLGLAIARELVALHGGTLEAHSAGIGEGTRLTLRLPMTKRLDVPPARRPNAEALRGVSLIVVDDDQRVLGALEILLARAGATVRCATSVADAWDMLRTDVPDVVVSDIAMPIASGYELVHRMRADAALARVPAIALTAHAAIHDARRSIAEGFNAHVSKPLELESLVATIARLARH
jgi:two-component system, chemotaxis family, CheB/CheR fusion protein